jgi:deoxyribonuclease-4
MLLIGAHVSIAGGIYKALFRGKEVGCSTIQVFLRSNVAWNPGKFTQEDVQKYRRARDETGIWPVIAHSCYLVNLASTDKRTLARSIGATAGELERAEVLGIPYLVMHPGAHRGAGERLGLPKIARGIDRSLRASGSRNVRILLETTAGQGTVLGWRFEQLAQIIAQSAFAERIGVCYDTCHTFAAGYDIRTRQSYESTMAEFDRVIGLQSLMCFHVNDARHDLASRLDRHAHIGKGRLGEAAFGFILRDERFAHVPKILETPTGTYRNRPWDRTNLDTLRRLAGDDSQTR